ncbi:MAG: energy transducer TonB [candidate division WOR-3 bacterium]|uniref:Energy transducer TonB n=1 Tax=candidate division WOR-3 bacterium TaxID=2052148 RepID=A0A7C1SK27_UNCW3|nr:energy transducer TonB [candidate division WOR-3 bacterium]
MMDRERSLRAFEIALVISTIVHISLLLLLSRYRTSGEAEWDLQEVTFMDVTYRPEVARVLSQNPLPAGGGGQDAGDVAVPTYGTGVASEEVAPLDLSSTLERSESQARIELDRYELARDGEMDVIRIGGKGAAQTTEEILAQAPISLSRGSGSGSGAGMGLRGIPGVPQQPQPQLSIEHRPVAARARSALPPPPEQVQSTVQVPVSRGTSFQIAGPISQREIIKKVKPKYPKWALDQHISGTVTVRIWVLPNGQVKGIPQVLSSSGYPELDQVVVDAVRCWEFAPLGTGVKAEEQWGDITFVFQLS